MPCVMGTWKLSMESDSFFIFRCKMPVLIEGPASFWSVMRSGFKRISFKASKKRLSIMKTEAYPVLQYSFPLRAMAER